MKKGSYILLVAFITSIFSCEKKTSEHSFNKKSDTHEKLNLASLDTLINSKWVYRYYVEPGDEDADTIIITQYDTLKYISTNGPSGDLYYTKKKDSLFIHFTFEFIDPCTEKSIISRDNQCYVIRHDSLIYVYVEQHWPCDSSELSRLYGSKSDARIFSRKK